jgi:ABC-2 type transport system ATP-binding protein
MPDTQQTRVRVEDVLAQVGLAERGNDTYKKYSFGMKQRLGIAAALLNQPELIILDEPTNGLDPAGVVEIRQLIRQLAQQGITVLLSSHLLYEVQQVCNRVAIIKLGNLLYQGTVQSMLANGQGITLSFSTPEILQQAYATLQTAVSVNEQFQWLREIHIVPAEPGLWTPPGGQVLRVLAPIERGTEINRLLGAQDIYATEIRQYQSNLEQVFLEVTGPVPPQMGPVSVPS